MLQFVTFPRDDYVHAFWIVAKKQIKALRSDNQLGI